MQKTGIELIADERARQISQEGWTTEHDDQYRHGELAAAGAVYADASISLMHGVAPAELKEQILHFGCETPWPWDTIDEGEETVRRYKNVAWLEEYPEEGCCGLGAEIGSESHQPAETKAV